MRCLEHERNVRWNTRRMFTRGLCVCARRYVRGCTSLRALGCVKAKLSGISFLFNICEHMHYACISPIMWKNLVCQSEDVLSRDWGLKAEVVWKVDWVLVFCLFSVKDGHYCICSAWTLPAKSLKQWWACIVQLSNYGWQWVHRLNTTPAV